MKKQEAKGDSVDQTLFNIVVSVVGFLGGWILNMLHTEIKNQSKHLNEIEVLVAGKYVTQEKLDHALLRMDETIDKSLSKIDTKLDAIFEKLDKKADK